MWCHYDSVSIVAWAIFDIHLDELHNSWTLINLSELLLEFVKDGWAVGLIVSRGSAFNLLLINLNVNKVAIIIGLNRCASPPI